MRTPWIERSVLLPGRRLEGPEIGRCGYTAKRPRLSIPDLAILTAALQEKLARLKAAGVLKGSRVGVVQSHFHFRNSAMHADWDKIDVVGVKTVAALVQELLLKHF